MKAKVTANGVRLYESNSTTSGAKGFAKYGTELDIEAEYGGWCKLTDGRWIEACFTKAVEVDGGASSWNDLEDKPFEYTPETVIEWNDNVTGMEPVMVSFSANKRYYWVSDFIPAAVWNAEGWVSKIGTAEYLAYDGSAMTMNMDATGSGDIFQIPNFGYIALKDNAEEWNNDKLTIRLPKKGLYFNHPEIGTELVTTKMTFYESVRPIDEKFLPSSGGGAQADWSVSDESDPACILNKPFGDGEPSTVWLDFRQMANFETVDCPTVMDYNAEEEVTNVGATEDDKFAIEIDEDIYGEYGPNEYSTSAVLLIGNACLYQFRYEDTGEPFCFAIEGTKVKAHFTDGGTHNVFLRKKQKINQIPSKYLPKAKSVTYAAGDTPTKAEFDALISSLCSAGYLEYPTVTEDEEE